MEDDGGEDQEAGEGHRQEARREENGNIITERQTMMKTEDVEMRCEPLR